MSCLERERKTEQEQPAFLYLGDEVNLLPESRKSQITVQVSKRLKDFPFTMIQYSPETLLQAMGEGRTIVCLGQQGEKLLAFAQIWHYEQNLSGQEVYEFGSWLSFERGGHGRKVLIAARELGFDLFPNSQLIAIVENYNTIAQRIIMEEGGVFLSHKYSEHLRTQGGLPAFMQIYDITKKESV